MDARIASDATDSGPSWQEVYSWALWLLTKSRPKLHLQREKSGKQSAHQASRAQRASVVPLQARGQNMQDVEKYLKLAKTHIFRALYPGMASMPAGAWRLYWARVWKSFSSLFDQTRRANWEAAAAADARATAAWCRRFRSCPWPHKSEVGQISGM